MSEPSVGIDAGSAQEHVGGCELGIGAGSAHISAVELNDDSEHVDGCELGIGAGSAQISAVELEHVGDCELAAAVAF
jgi:hypothetical protein